MLKEDKHKCYISNYFMEKELDKKGYTNVLILFKTTKEKNNPSRKKELEVIL